MDSFSLFRQTQTGIQSLRPLIGDFHLLQFHIRTHGKKHFVGSSASETSGVFAPTGQQARCLVVFDIPSQKSTFHYGDNVLRNVVFHIQKDILVTGFRIGEAVVHTVVSGGYFGFYLIAVQIYLIIIGRSHFIGLRRVVFRLAGFETDLRRDKHLSVASPPNAGNMQLSESANHIVFIVSVVTAVGSLRRRVHRAMRQLRANYTITAVLYPHEHIYQRYLIRISGEKTSGNNY